MMKHDGPALRWLACAAVGLRVALGMHPAGGAIRDSAQLRYIERFLSRVSVAFLRELEAVIPVAGDLRAIDIVLRTSGCLIAVEVTEIPPSQRRDAVRRILADPARRPAIVYAPSRKEADALGAELRQDFSAAAYHAGMNGADRDRVQSGFLSGKLEVIVATIAFGMGVDKADVRTVIHTGRRVATAEGRVVDDHDRLIAHATTTCMILPS